MTDRIEILGLALDCSVGVYDWEKAVPQQILVDIKLPTDAAQGAASDDLKDALDYTAVVDCLQKIVDAKHYNLVETLVECMAQALLKDFQLAWVELAVDKPAAIGSAKSTRICVYREA